jgi:hypothetical protein
MEVLVAAFLLMVGGSPRIRRRCLTHILPNGGSGSAGASLKGTGALFPASRRRIRAPCLQWLIERELGLHLVPN